MKDLQKLHYKCTTDRAIQKKFGAKKNPPKSRFTRQIGKIDCGFFPSLETASSESERESSIPVRSEQESEQNPHFVPGNSITIQNGEFYAAAPQYVSAVTHRRAIGGN